MGRDTDSNTDSNTASNTGPGRRSDRRRSSPLDGLAVVDKAAGYTSHDVVARMRGIVRTRRVGHAGTLDPMATGVLVLGIGKATRLLGHLALTDKEYRATVRLGQRTVTDDAEGEVTETAGARPSQITREALDSAIARLTGDIMQVPAKVSAVKIDGKRSYARVREGEDVELAARPVTVSAFEVHELREVTAADTGGGSGRVPVLDLDTTVVCSSGTYIRALARDLGAALGTGGHLTALRRTRVGPYGLDAAHTLDEHERTPQVVPIGDAAAAAFPRWDVDDRQAKLLANGVQIDMPQEMATPAGRPVAAFGPGGRFLALVEERGGRAKSLAVFA